MSWTIQIADDPDTTGEKTVTATWTDPAYEHPFTFSRRIKTIYAGYVGFVAQAKAALVVWQARQAELIEIRDWLLGMINT